MVLVFLRNFEIFRIISWRSLLLHPAVSSFWRKFLKEKKHDGSADYLIFEMRNFGEL